jgi:hypothetical protein
MRRCLMETKGFVYIYMNIVSSGAPRLSNLLCSSDMRSNDDEVMMMMTHCCLTLEEKHTPDQMASTEMPMLNTRQE